MGPDGSGKIALDLDSHPSEKILRVLSDMARLYGHGKIGLPTPKRRDLATSHKLGYYAARVLSVPGVTLRVLADEVLARSKLIVLESADGGGQSEGSFGSNSRSTAVKPRPIIEQL